MFLYGLLNNLSEKQFSSMQLPEYCPVLFALPLGVLNVMPFCTPLTTKQFESLCFFDLVPKDRFCMFNNLVEYKQDSLGIYKGAIVAVDYHG